MRLESIFEDSFEKYYFKTNNPEDMTGYKISKSTEKFIDVMVESHFGESFTHLKAEKKKMDAIAVKYIVYLYKIQKRTIDEIAAELELEPQFIHDALKAKKMIK